MIRRLFIFAAYDKNNVVDATLLHYLRALSELGDIVFMMDNNIPKSEMDKIKKIPNVLCAKAVRHNEYDFGSYKRGYLYAYDNNLLKNYDFVYFVNDSVYGPLWDLKPVLEKLESKKTDVIGMIDYHSDENPLHIQSWFVGLSNIVSRDKCVKEFFEQVKHQQNKSDIILKYEVRFSTLLINKGYKTETFVHNKDLHNMYIRPLNMLEEGIPFIKKQALINIKCSSLLYQYSSSEIIDAIKENADRLGIDYVKEYEQKNEFEKIYRLTFLSIPICTIWSKESTGDKRYKIYLFDKIRIMKIVKKNI